MIKLGFWLLFSTFLWAQDNNLQEAIDYQQNLNKEFADSLTSPLIDEDRRQFTTLDFFPVSDKYVVKAKFKKAKREVPFEMKTTTSRVPKYIKHGTLFFKIDGRKFRLNVYRNIEFMNKPGFSDYLFLPFFDTTNGKETYIGGRYLDLTIPKSKTITLDFNKAYNPYCAYNYKYSCPIVPLENDLDIEIKAGVKKFHD